MPVTGNGEYRLVPSEALERYEGVELTEDGVARAFAAAHHGRLRFCHTVGKWHVWDGSRWRANEDRLAFDYARQLTHRLSRDAAPKSRAVVGRAGFIKGVETIAQSDRQFAVTSDVWDLDPMRLGVPGGVVELRTGQLRPARQDDNITKQTAVAPAHKADCPQWLRFLTEACGNDLEVVQFLQRWSGYCLTGETREHALLFIYGPGGNGKSVFLNTMSKLLGDYSSTAAMDTFTHSHSDRHPTDLAMLRGARLVSVSETEEGKPWAEQRIKLLTGGDPVTARFMKRDFFTYTPSFKLTIVGNHKPRLRNVDEAMRRRLNIVPFIQRPAHPDRTLEQRLQREWPAIFRWAIDGCLEWQERGLEPPAKVTDVTRDYFEQQDVVGQWIKERCLVEEHLETKPGHLLTDFLDWARGNGEDATDNRRLRPALEQRGFEYKRRRGEQHVRGLGLRPRKRGGPAGAAPQD